MTEFIFSIILCANNLSSYAWLTYLFHMLLSFNCLAKNTIEGNTLILFLWSFQIRQKLYIRVDLEHLRKSEYYFIRYCFYHEVTAKQSYCISVLYYQFFCCMVQYVENILLCVCFCKLGNAVNSTVVKYFFIKYQNTNCWRHLYLECWMCCKFLFFWLNSLNRIQDKKKWFFFKMMLLQLWLMLFIQLLQSIYIRHIHHKFKIITK
jgi:hypothetical protein